MTTSAKDVRSPPGPPQWPIVGNLFNADVSAFLRPRGMKALYDEYGPVVRLTVPGADMCYISDVELQKEVLKQKAKSFTNGDVFRKVFGYFFPTSVIVVEGEQWQRIRRVIQRAIQGTRLSEALQPMHTVVGRADELLVKPGQPCDIHSLASSVTLDSFGFWAYNVDFNTIGGENPHILASCGAISDVLSQRAQLPLPILWKLPTKQNRAADEGLRVLSEYSAKILDERFAQELAEGEQKDLMSAMVAASQAEPDSKARMTREELIDNIGTIFFGAYDTTSATIAFTMNFLAINPDAQASLAAELAGCDLSSISREGLGQLTYLDKVCREANRLLPTAGGFARTAKEDVQIGGYHLAKGTQCIIDHLTLPAQNPTLWGGQADLDQFRPERWGEVKPHRLASLPFGFGGRVCPGNNLATMEHKFIVAYLVQRYSWNADPSRPMEVAMKVGFCPKDGCWLIPEPRHATVGAA